MSSGSRRSSSGMKKPPKLSVARSTVPRLGFKRYRKPLDEVAIGTDVRLTFSARMMVSLAMRDAS